MRIIVSLFCLIVLTVVSKPSYANTEKVVINFQTGSFELSMESRHSLQGFLESLHPNDVSFISIIGATDNIGDDEYNIELSKLRVKKVLNAYAVQFSRFTVEFAYYGEMNPIASNATLTGRSKNRRVEVVAHLKDPLNGFLPTVIRHNVDPTSDTILAINDRGTQIHIPSGAFVHKNGRLVLSDVEITFLEYRNSASMAFSGIPMTYGDGYFNSAGMFEIRGTANGEGIFIAEDKNLKVDYALVQKPEGIDFYRLDETTQSWVKQQGIKKRKPKNGENKVKLGRRKPDRSNLVTKYIGDTQGSAFDYDTVFVVNKRTYRRTWWRVGAKRIRVADRAWRKVRNNAELVYDNKWQPTHLPLPVFDPDDRKSATLLAEGMDAGHTYPDIVKGLNVGSFGVYNCDQVYRLGKQVSVRAKYVDEEGNPINGARVLSLIDLNYNGAFSFKPGFFSCNPNGRNTLALFTKSGELYLLPEEEFQTMGISSDGSYTFTMQNMTEQIKNSDDLAEYLDLEF